MAGSFLAGFIFCYYTLFSIFIQGDMLWLFLYTPSI